MIDFPIPDIDEMTWRALAERAARNGRSIEEEARQILTDAFPELAAKEPLIR